MERAVPSPVREGLAGGHLYLLENLTDVACIIFQSKVLS